MLLERLILKSKLVTLFDLFLDQCLQIQVKGAGTRKLRRRNMAWVGSLINALLQSCGERWARFSGR